MPIYGQIYRHSRAHGPEVDNVMLILFIKVSPNGTPSGPSQLGKPRLFIELTSTWELHTTCTTNGLGGKCAMRAKQLPNRSTLYGQLLNTFHKT